MTEPHTAAFAIVTAIGLGSSGHNVDGNALIGAMAGAALVVVNSQELSPLKRIVYMLISLAMGDQAAPEIVYATPIQSTGVAAFIAAALVITITLQLIERVKAFNLFAFLKK